MAFVRIYKFYKATILEFENKLQYNLPSGKKRGFAYSLRANLFFTRQCLFKRNIFV